PVALLGIVHSAGSRAGAGRGVENQRGAALVPTWIDVSPAVGAREDHTPDVSVSSGGKTSGSVVEAVSRTGPGGLPAAPGRAGRHARARSGDGPVSGNDGGDRPVRGGLAGPQFSSRRA